MLLSVKTFIFILLRFHDTDGSIFHSKGSRMKLHIAQISAISGFVIQDLHTKKRSFSILQRNGSFWGFCMINLTMCLIVGCENAYFEKNGNNL